MEWPRKASRGRNISEVLKNAEEFTTQMKARARGKIGSYFKQRGQHMQRKTQRHTEMTGVRECLSIFVFCDVGHMTE